MNWPNCRIVIDLVTRKVITIIETIGGHQIPPTLILVVKIEESCGIFSLLYSHCFYNKPMQLISVRL